MGDVKIEKDVQVWKEIRDHKELQKPFCFLTICDYRI